MCLVSSLWLLSFCLLLWHGWFCWSFSLVSSPSFVFFGDSMGSMFCLMNFLKRNGDKNPPSLGLMCAEYFSILWGERYCCTLLYGIYLIFHARSIIFSTDANGLLLARISIGKPRSKNISSSSNFYHMSCRLFWNPFHNQISWIQLRNIYPNSVKWEQRFLL